MAVEKEMPPQSQKSDVGVQDTGLRGVYFNDKYFHKPVLISDSTNGELTLKKEEIQDLLSAEKQQIQSVRWVGTVVPSETDEYIFSTSSDKQVKLQVNGDLVIDQAPTEKKIKLEKGKSYEIIVEYLPSQEQTNSDINLQLFWTTTTKTKEIIPKENLKSPELIQKKQKTKVFSKKSLFYWDDDEWDEDLDTDDDSIPDIWEIEGYTIKRQMAVKWDDSLAELGYKKYVSNPYEKHTAGDPYTDYQKAANRMDSANDKSTRNPLVAAYPKIGVVMDNLTISKNNDITQTTGGDTSTSFTKGTSNSKTNETSNGIDNTVSASVSTNFFPFGGISLDTSYSYTNTFNESNSSTSTIDESNTESSGENWAQSIGINTAQSAFLGPRVRYINTGTAPVYQLQPDISIGIGKNHTLTSGIVDEKYKANVLNPGQVFPKKNSLPILANKHEGMPISIDYNELLELEKNKEIRLDSTQFDGIVSATGDPGSMEKWEKYTNRIEHVTSKIIFVTPDNWIERRIAASRDPEDPEDMYPKINLIEAMDIGFEGFKKTEKGYQMGDYVFEKLHIIMDENTTNKFIDQAKQEPDGRLDPKKMQLNAGMNIQVSPSGFTTNTKTKKKYYFKDGQMIIGDGIKEFDGKIYCFNSFGEIQTGAKFIDGKRYYFDETTGESIQKIKLSPRTKDLVTLGEWDDWGRNPNNKVYLDMETKKMHVFIGDPKLRNYSFEPLSNAPIKIIKTLEHPDGVIEKVITFDDEENFTYGFVFHDKKNGDFKALADWDLWSVEYIKEVYKEFYGDEWEKEYEKEVKENWDEIWKELQEIHVKGGKNTKLDTFKTLTKNIKNKDIKDKINESIKKYSSGALNKN
ncbi:PA14 domain-containing protein [Bacillus cereus]|nr:PA14 domain-containing protein [Bacillus cereus]